MQGVTKATTDIKGIVLSKDATLQEKSNKLGAYVVVGPSGRPRLAPFADVVQDQVKPVVDEIYNYVLGAKVSLAY